jgi:hypothetical protein
MIDGQLRMFVAAVLAAIIIAAEDFTFAQSHARLGRRIKYFSRMTLGRG